MENNDEINIGKVLKAVTELSKELALATKQNALNIESLGQRIESRIEHQDQKLDKIIAILEGTIVANAELSKKDDSHEVRLTNLEAEQFMLRKQIRELREG
jgi:hypothetical protein